MSGTRFADSEELDSMALNIDAALAVMSSKIDASINAINMRIDALEKLTLHIKDYVRELRLKSAADEAKRELYFRVQFVEWNWYRELKQAYDSADKDGLFHLHCEKGRFSFNAATTDPFTIVNYAPWKLVCPSNGN